MHKKFFMKPRQTFINLVMILMIFSANKIFPNKKSPRVKIKSRALLVECSLRAKFRSNICDKILDIILKNIMNVYGGISNIFL